MPAHNPFFAYLWTAYVDALASAVHDRTIEPEGYATHKPRGMYEFAMPDPNGMLVRIGWPSRLMR